VIKICDGAVARPLEGVDWMTLNEVHAPLLTRGLLPRSDQDFCSPVRDGIFLECDSIEDSVSSVRSGMLDRYSRASVNNISLLTELIV